MNPLRPRHAPSTRIGVARALTATTASAAALSVVALAGPVLAAPDGGSQAAWQSAWTGAEDVGGDVWVQGSVIDPTTGDVLTFGHHGGLPGHKRLRRVSGETGATLWEVGLPPEFSGGMALAYDPAAGRTVVAGQEPSVSTAASKAVVHSVASDGSLGWTREVVGKGELIEMVVDPRTGTSCLSSGSKGRAGSGKLTATWHLTCLDRAGATTLSKSFTHSGVGTAPALAVDPDRQRWYVAGTHRTKKGQRLVLVSYDAAGKRVWARVRDWRGALESRVAAITVDQNNHRVHVGGSVVRTKNQGKKNQGTKYLGTLTTWNAAGRLAFDRSWSSEQSQDVLDLAVDSGSHRLFAATSNDRYGVSVRLMSSKGRLKKVVRHDGGPGNATAQLEIDPERRLVLVGSESVGVYTWGGKPVWRDTSEKRLVRDVDHDADRGRLVVTWSSLGDLGGGQRAWVTAWSS